MAIGTLTIILPCLCDHKDQDEMYGKGRRVHNIATDGMAYCTVCTPRRLSCDKNGSDVTASPLFGHGFIAAARPRRGKPIPADIAKNVIKKK